MDERIRNLEDRMSDIERTQRHINEKVRSEEFIQLIETARELDNLLKGNGLEDFIKAVKELTIIMHGDERLGVKPLRQQVSELYTFYDRARWGFGALGITNAGIIITYLLTLIGRSMP